MISCHSGFVSGGLYHMASLKHLDDVDIFFSLHYELLDLYREKDELSVGTQSKFAE